MAVDRDPVPPSGPAHDGDRGPVTGDELVGPVVAEVAQAHPDGRVHEAAGPLRGVARDRQGPGEERGHLGPGVRHQAGELGVLTEPARGQVDRGQDPLDGPAGLREVVGDDQLHARAECAPRRALEPLLAGRRGLELAAGPGPAAVLHAHSIDPGDAQDLTGRCASAGNGQTSASRSAGVRNSNMPRTGRNSSGGTR